jgi:phosphoglycolate phosphatase-like HAD superfamily hydrolase
VRPAVYLWDIDGTLVSSDGAGRRAIQRAFGAVASRPDATDGFSFAGMTDRAIARRGLDAVGLVPTDAAIEAVIAAYLEYLEEEVRLARDYRLHEGVLPAVDATLARPAAAVGLGTGNVAEGARIKLTRLGIADRFRFGGFGSDDEDRARLLAVGAERGAELLGLPRRDCRVVVIGDTPKDIAAAHAIGAEAVAVATGPFSVDELRASGPEHVFSHLGVPGAVDVLIA